MITSMGGLTTFPGLSFYEGSKHAMEGITEGLAQEVAQFGVRVTAVAPGTHVVAWEVSAGLYGKAKAVLPTGATPGGTFTVYIAHAPQQSYVNNQGQVVASH